MTREINRRQLLQSCGMGLGALGLQTLLKQEGLAGGPLSVKPTHFPARAKRMIHIFCSGGPSQIDTFDPKPALNHWAGKSVPEIGGAPLPCPYKFTKRGASGIEISELFPNLGGHVDKLAILRAMHTDVPEHRSAQLLMHTGAGQLPRPSIGSWLLYGLGTENTSLPGFVAIGNGGFGGAKCWHNGFLPSVYQGTNIATVRESVEQMLPNIRNQSLTLAQQRRELDLTQALNRLDSERHGAEADLDARVHAFELAFNMQTEAADVFDLSRETTSTRKLYGGSKLATSLIAARRMVEQGVRFVQVWHGSWDHHDKIYSELPALAQEADEAIAGLLADLEQRGLLKETLVLWGGEFGRTPGYDKGGKSEPGRDHHNAAFTAWLAGGGVRGGTIHGATDEFGMTGIEGRVHTHDLHATILHLMGFDHERLTYRYNGRDFRLTDVYGKVVREVLA